VLRNMFDLTGKVAMIAGGAGGIGSACARAIAEFGAHVAIADKNAERARVVAESISAAGGKASSLALDVTDYSAIEAATRSVVRNFGAIDILLNNVGTTVRKPLLETTPEEWTRVLNVNLTAAFFLCQVVGKEFVKNKRGKFIQIVSTGGLRAGANFSAYGASKAGLIHLVKTLALEWAPYEINVNAIAPTATDTDFTAEYYAQFPERKAQTIANHPFKRLGTPNDYAGAAVYLASSAADFVNGEVIVVDSGKTV
jgi:NAD(P)-dependent dehydrogenase (short-subunit alcohol dehydrogenase family)